MLFRSRGDEQWRGVVKGVRAWVLNDTGQSRSVIMQFRPGIKIPSHRHAADEECIVLSGSLDIGDTRVGPHDFHLAPAGSRHPALTSSEGGVAFLRGTTAGNVRGMLREYYAGWLPGKGKPATTIRADSGWRAVADGVEIKPLLSAGEESSILLRLKPGAGVPAPAKRAVSECLLVSGEAFVGDMLLREGEYQRGPDSVPQGDTYSDIGALLYLHGHASLAEL